MPPCLIGRIWSTIRAAVVSPRAAQWRHSGSRFSVALRIACHRRLLYAGSTTLGGLYVVELACFGGSVPSLKGLSLFNGFVSKMRQEARCNALIIHHLTPFDTQLAVTPLRYTPFSMISTTYNENGNSSNPLYVTVEFQSYQRLTTQV